MSVSPDTDVLYDEAIALEQRIVEYEAKKQAFWRLARDIELDLLSNGFMPEADPEIRIRAAGLRANQMLEENQPDLFAFLDAEDAAIRAIRIRNDGLVTAGWVKQFAYTSWTRKLRGADKQSELEA